MPCDDTTSKIVLSLSGNDTLVDYRYEKVLCGKVVGHGSGLKDYCTGKTVDDLCNRSFGEIRDLFSTCNQEDEFLLHLEWKAVSEALRQYSGKSSADRERRYLLSSIRSEGDITVITMLITPPEDMPAIAPC